MIANELLQTASDQERLWRIVEGEKINDAFDLMHKGESIRSVVVF